MTWNSTPVPPSQWMMGTKWVQEDAVSHWFPILGWILLELWHPEMDTSFGNGDGKGIATAEVCLDTVGLRKIPVGHFSCATAAWRAHAGLGLLVWIPLGPPVWIPRARAGRSMESTWSTPRCFQAGGRASSHPTRAIPRSLEELSPWGHPWSLSPPSHQTLSSPPTPRPPALPILVENQPRLPSQHCPLENHPEQSHPVGFAPGPSSSSSPQAQPC